MTERQNPQETTSSSATPGGTPRTRVTRPAGPPTSSSDASTSGRHAKSSTRAPRGGSSAVGSRAQGQAAERLRQEHDDRHTRVDERLEDLERLAFQGTSPKLAFLHTHLNEADVRNALGIEPDVELTAEVLHAAVIDRIARLEDDVNNLKKDARRSQADFKALEKAVAEDHDNMVHRVIPRIQTVEEILGEHAEALQEGVNGGRKSFIQALRDRNVSDDDIREVLVILDDGNELNLNDSDLFAETYTKIATYGPRLSQVEQDVDNIRKEVVVIREQVTEVVDGGKVKPIGFLIGTVAAVLAFLLMRAMQGGSFDNNRDFGFAFFLSAAIGFGVAFCTVGYGSSSKKNTSSSKSETTTSDESNSAPKKSLLEKMQNNPVSRSLQKNKTANAKLTSHDDSQDEVMVQRPTTDVESGTKMESTHTEVHQDTRTTA
jgi:hypothetical protein